MRGRKPDPEAPRRGTAHHATKPAALAPLEYSGAIAPAQVGRIALPKGLPRTRALRSLWQEILTEVARSELRRADLPLLESLLIAAYRRTQATLLVAQLGVLVRGPGGPVLNPALKEERNQALLYDRLAQRVGLSLESRVRLRLMELAGSSLLSALAREAQEAAATLEGVEVIDGEVVVED
jgi:hypothetical protein